MKAPALVERFPKPPWWRPDVTAAWAKDWPVVPADRDDDYPELAADLALWRVEFEHRFRRLDHEAQVLQNRFWRQRVTLILGGLVLTVLGVWQTAAGGQKALGAIQAVLAGLLVGLTTLAKGRDVRRGYLTARLKAERIKSEFFLFLGRVGDYAGDDGADRLRERVDELECADDIS